MRTNSSPRKAAKNRSIVFKEEADSQHLTVEVLSSCFKSGIAAERFCRGEVYRIICITKGSGNLLIDFEPFSIRPDRVFFALPGQLLAPDVVSDMEGFLITFPKMYFQSLLLNPEYPTSLSFFSGIPSGSVLDLHAQEKEVLEPYLFKMLTQAGSDFQGHPDSMRIRLLELLILFEEWQRNGKPQNSVTPPNRVLVNFQKLIEKHYAAIRLPTTYAAMLLITPNHLNAICKAQAGLQAGEMIRNRTILEAKRLLVMSGRSIAEIAGALNFADNSYFTKFFKKYTGQTPEGFRRAASKIVDYYH